VHPLQVHRLRGGVPGFLLSRGSELPGHRSDECIDCDICVPECPVDAIFPAGEVPAGQTAFIALNAELARSWPVIDVRKDPPHDAAEWAAVKDKLAYLER